VKRTTLSLLGALLVGAFVGPSVATAQQPTTGQVTQALQNPDIVAQLRTRLQASGMTNDQVRARLREMGYPEGLLDAYLPDAGASPAPTVEAIDAMRRLGLIEEAAQAQQRPTLPAVDTVKPDTAAARIFGIDVFRSSTSRFDPLTSGPVDVNYRVGPKDVLAIILTGGVEATYSLEVSPDGFIVIPQVGQVFVANLTLDQIKDVLYTRIGRVYSGLGRSSSASTQLSVSVARVRTNQVFVIGEVMAPGSYQVSSAGTMLTALYASGGPTANGNLRAVELRRGGRSIDTLDLYDYLVRGDAGHDQPLQSGDILFVPFHGTRVSVRGEVGRPEIFELKPGETLRDLVRYAGGFTPNAARHRIQIRRILAPSARDRAGMERVVLDIPPDQLLNGDVPPFPIEPGDQIAVFGVSDVERNQIAVVGHVWAPGTLGLRSGMRLSDALKASGGVRPGVLTDQVLITRHTPNEVTPVQLRTSFVDSTGRPANDFVLAEGDSVRVFSRAEFSETRTIGVAGAVHAPSAIPYREGMTLRDAVLLAGGLDESAYLEQAEIARVEAAPGGGTAAATFRVPLDSTYLFERGPNGEYLGPPGIPAPVARAPEVPLRPYDHILILRQPGWDLSRRVRVTGEVKFPGTYTLRSQSERLDDLMKRVGGVTPQGYAQGAVFVRSADSTGRIDISLARALANEGSLDNLVLMDGDSIHVPRYSPVVKVRGAVNSPTSVSYMPGADLNYYIAAAGGTLSNGDRNRSYVTQPNGTRQVYRHRIGFIPDGVPKPEAGAEIYVPIKPEQKASISDRLVPITQALTGLVTIIYLVSKT